MGIAGEGVWGMAWREDRYVGGRWVGGTVRNRTEQDGHEGRVLLGGDRGAIQSSRPLCTRCYHSC